MNKLLRKLTAVVSAAAAVTVGGIIGLSALAESYGEQTELDISCGNITISDDSVSGYDSSGNTVTATDPDGYIITGSTDTYTVTVSGKQKITLKDASIDLTNRDYFCAFDIGNGGNVTLTLEGVNTIKSGKSCAGIDVIEGEMLEITGTGTLTVTGGQYGAGIGTGETIAGNLSCGSVVISGGSVLATGGENGATVGNGAYYESFEGEAPRYINGDFCPPKDKVGNELYPCTINNPDSETVYIDGVEFTPNIHSDSEKRVYAYLTNVTHYINVGDKPYYTTLNNGSLEVNEVVVGSAFSINATSGELVYGKDYTYPAETGVLTILSETAVTISNTDNSNSTTDIIVVAKDVSANITLDGVNIAVSGTPDTCAFKIADDSEGNVTITLADGSVNTMISGSGCAGLQKNGANGTLEIKGTTGTLTATGGTNGAGIGGGNGSEGSGIIINGGSVKAVAGTGANAIGGGEGKAPVTPTNSSGKPVYLLTITGASVTVDNVAYTPIDGTVYAYLTEGEHTITVDGNNTTNHYLANTQNNLVAVGTNLTITADSGEALVYGKDYTYPADTGVLTILSDKAVTISNTDNSNSTTDTIVVAKHVLANITLNGVSIDVSATSGKPAFEIAENSTGNVTVTLAGDNTLKSGSDCAGLQKNGSVVTIGTLTIKDGANGTGTLTATGGDGGAGIGGGYMGAAKNIVIENATVTAKGDSGIGSGNQGGGVDGIQIINSTVKATGSGGAGIGGSDDSSLSDLYISNSTVTATGGASGIGGGTGGSQYCGGDCTNVTIEDSVVVATGSGGAGIGTGNANEDANRSNDGFSYCKNITINNSVVTAKGSEGAAGIGGGVMGKCENVKIYGSSVIAEGNGVPAIGWGKYSEKDMETNEYVEYSGKAVNATSSGNTVYPFTIANPTGAAVTIDGTKYAYANHSAADKTDTNFYAYLTGEDHTVTIGEVTTEYKFYDGIFLPVPKASDFTFTAPENLKYTGEAKTATVTSDKNGMGVITTKYYNASGDEVTQGADFVPGTYTVKIDVAKGDKYVEATDITDASWKFTITAGDLTVSGTGKASGTFGDKLSKLTVSGLTAKFGDTEIKGTWALSGNTIPNVGDSAYYTATFTPNENADRYNELTAEVSLDIAQANAPEIEDIKLTYSWAATGEKTANVSGLPDNMGTLGKLTAEISDENGVLTAGSASYSDGKVYFTLNSNTEENVGNKATIKVTLPSQNYKDITFSVIVAITAKLDKDAPAENEFELSFDLLSDNTYKATITTALTGVEFSFDGVNWSSTNTKAVGHAETVTGYIRYEETDEYSVSPYSSKTAVTGHGTLTHHDAKAATCTEDGNIEYWTCDSCKLYFSDANGTTEITQAQTVLTKLGHKWAEKYNFDKDGHWHKCEVCGDTSEKEAHVSGGAATADSAEICTVCSYEIAPKLGQVAVLLFAPNGGTFTEIQTVTITCATEGAEIYYTTDGSDPTTSSTKYTGAITINATTTVKAIAVKDGMENSEVVSATFTKKSSGGGSSGGSSGGGSAGGGSAEPDTPEPPKKGDVVADDKASVTVEVTDVAKKKVEYKEPANKKAKTVSIPATVKVDGVTYKVTKVDDNAFKNNKTVTKVTVGSNIETIGKNAFYKCTKLKTVKIGKNVTTIGSNAFKGCTSLTSVTLPGKATKIGANAFSGCRKLKTIKITSTKLTSTSVSKNAFKGLTKATTIKVPKKKLSAYKKLFKQKGLSSKVKVKGY